MTLEFQNFGIEQPLVLTLILPMALILFLYIRKPGMNMKKWLFLSSRSLLFLLVLIALSSPYLIEFTEKFQDVSSVTILSDGSESMSLYKENESLANTIYHEIKNRMKNSTGFESVNMREFSSGNRTEIGNALYQNLVGLSKENNLLILISDGNNNYGRSSKDVARILGETGARIFALTPKLSEDEIYIKGINGEKRVPANSDYRFTVDIAKLGKAAKYRLDLFVDDQKVNSSIIRQGGDTRSVGYTISFKELGVHKITAEIIPESGDYFELNNRFTKTVDVVEKPSILIVTDQENSPLVQVLKENYDVTVTDDVRKNFKDYCAVFLDNQNSSILTSDVVNSLHEYVIDGNGLVVVGGDRAYEKGGYHENHQFEAILPVRSIEEPEKRRKEIAVVLMIDISQSAGYGLTKNPKIDVEKALALNIVRQLDPNDYVGVIAFNVEAFTISNIRKLSENRDEIEDRIPRLRFGGGTDMLHALDRADRLLEDFSCKKYLIIISDGVIWTAGRINALKKIKAMSKKGITTYTIGVGFDTDEGFMNQLASDGNGLYFRPEEWERLKLEFEEKEEKRDEEKYQLDIYNKYHFITQNIELSDTTIKRYNSVSGKSIAQVLITTEAKKPVVTVWRFGLGRVVSITTDNGIKWSPNLYSSENGRLISSITNWAIGDLEKKKRVRMETDDIPLGREAEIIIRCDKLPRVVAQKGGYKEEISLKQIDIDLYSGGFAPKETGFYFLKAVVQDSEDTDAIAVNYPVEFSRLGINREGLSEITTLTNGMIYNSSQIEQLEDDAMKFIREGSLKRIKEKIPLHLYFMIAAVSLFFIDVVIRRIREIMRLRKE